MKKYLISGVIAFWLFLGVFVLCIFDAYADKIFPYMFEVIVSNENGTNLVDRFGNKIFVPKGTELKFEGETKNDSDELVGIVYYNEFSYNVCLDDIILENMSIDLNEMEERRAVGYSENPIEIKVYKNGAYLYNMPAMKFGKVDDELEIPVGTVLTYQYSTTYFAYVTYNGVSGWIYYNEANQDMSSMYNFIPSTLFVSSESKKEYIYESLQMYEEPMSDVMIDMIVPAFSEIKAVDSILLAGLNEWWYINYNGISGWVNIESVPSGYKLSKDASLYTFKEKILYDKPNICEDKKQIGMVPKNSEVDVYYNVYIPSRMSSDYYDSYYIEYNGVKGWVSEYDVDVFDGNDYTFSGIISHYRYIVYDAVDGNKTGNILNENQEYSIKYEYSPWEYIITENFSGWINIGEQVENLEEDKIDLDVVNNEKNNNLLYIVIGIVILFVGSLFSYIIIKKRKAN